MKTLSRRGLFFGGLAAACVGHAYADPSTALQTRLEDLEKRSGGRLGCSVLDLATGSRTNHRGDERFPMCSTFKLAASGLVLQRVDRGQERLDRRITFDAKDLVTYSPVTEKHAGEGGMTLAELCLAAMTMSDNTAANLILASFGGPPAVTAFLRSIGDPVSRLDRNETTLNESKPGDPRDTTTPAAMLDNLHKLVLRDVLSPASTQTLIGWMVGNTTGDARLRAGLPKEWKIGDKTGSGDFGTTNDIAVIWRPHTAPILITAYLTECTLSVDARNAIHAEIGRAVSASL